MSKLISNSRPGEIDPNNTSTTPLAGGATWTGAWTDITSYGIAYVCVYSDVAGAMDGLVIEQSIDGVNAYFNDTYTVPAASGKVFAVNPFGNYIRIRYINGSGAQSIFQIMLKLNPMGLPSVHRVKDDLLEDDDAQLQKSILMIKANDQNLYRNVELNNPVPVNTGSLFQSDVNITYSDMNTFSGSPIDLLDNRWTTVTDTTANNPKIILLEFERAIQTSIIGIATESGSFSNTVIKYGLPTTADITLVDESTDGTAKTILVAPSTPITLTRIQLEFHTANTITLSALNLAKATQTIAQIQGIDPDNELKTIGASHIGNLNVAVQEYGDTSSIDAFARLRISTPYTLFDSKQLHDKQPLFWDEITAGSATSVHSSSDAATVMTVTASASDYVIRQTKLRPNYQPGKSQLLVFTMHAPQQTGVTMQIGAFDGTGGTYQTPYNGIWLEITESDITWNIAKNGSTTESVSQVDWNYDALDGTGPSTLTLDLDGTIIAFFDFEWLGVGRVRTGFFIKGLPRYTHFFYHSNEPSFTAVYMSTPNLPLRYYIESDGSGGGTLDHICSTVISEGGIQQTGVLRSVNTGTTHIDANAADTKYAVIGIRLQSTYYDITVLPEYFSMISETNDDFKWTLELNPTVAGTFTYNTLTNSSIEYALGATANTVTTGLVIDSGFSKSSATIDRKFVTALTLGSLIDGTMDELVLTVTPLSANADYQASLTFRELL